MLNPLAGGSMGGTGAPMVLVPVEPPQSGLCEPNIKGVGLIFASGGRSNGAASDPKIPAGFGPFSWGCLCDILYYLLTDKNCRSKDRKNAGRYVA